MIFKYNNYKILPRQSVPDLWYPGKQSEHFWPEYPVLQEQSPLGLQDVEEDPASLQSHAENIVEKTINKVDILLTVAIGKVVMPSITQCIHNV